MKGFVPMLQQDIKYFFHNFKKIDWSNKIRQAKKHTKLTIKHIHLKNKTFQQHILLLFQPKTLFNIRNISLFLIKIRIKRKKRNFKGNTFVFTYINTCLLLERVFKILLI